MYTTYNIYYQGASAASPPDILEHDAAPALRMVLFLHVQAACRLGVPNDHRLGGVAFRLGVGFVWRRGVNDVEAACYPGA